MNNNTSRTIMSVVTLFFALVWGGISVYMFTIGEEMAGLIFSVITIGFGMFLYHDYLFYKGK
jgi:hypothetical protein